LSAGLSHQQQVIALRHRWFEQSASVLQSGMRLQPHAQKPRKSTGLETAVGFSSQAGNSAVSPDAGVATTSNGVNG
jgi:hypothetical protein